MRWIPAMVGCAALVSGCTLFGDRPCEPGRYQCPSTDLGVPMDALERPCTVDNPCTLPSVMDRSLGGVVGDLVAISGNSGPAGEQVFIAGISAASQGMLLLAQPAQPIRTVATLPTSMPRALAVTPSEPLTVFIASQGGAFFQYDPPSGLVSQVPLDTGSCQGRINLTGPLNGVLALAGPDLWLVGAPTNDAAAGLFRVHSATCQVLPELASAGLSYNGVWGAPLSGEEPAARIVWTVGDSGAAVLWKIAAADGATSAQRFATDDGTRLVAVSGSASCPLAPASTDGGTGSACAYMISSGALYQAVDAAPRPVALPAVLQKATLASLFVDDQSVWLVGTLNGAGLVVRYKPQSAAFAYVGGLPPATGALHAAWGAGDGSLWVVGDRGTVLYVPPS